MHRITYSNVDENAHHVGRISPRDAQRLYGLVETRLFLGYNSVKNGNCRILRLQSLKERVEDLRLA